MGVLYGHQDRPLHMAQQGYGTADQVVLTPYLGQLHLVRGALSKDNDPVLNDLDSFDLVRAGLMGHASTAHTKRPIKLSTIGKRLTSPIVEMGVADEWEDNY